LATLIGTAVVLTVAPAPASAATKTTPTPVLAQGVGMGAEPSSAVRSVQRVLDSRGYDLGTPGVDGRFGPLTGRAVRRFQAHYGLAVDGVVGPKTHRVVRLAARRSPRAETTRPQAQPDQNAQQAPELNQQQPDRTTTTPQAPQSTTAANELRSQDNNLAWLLAVALAAALGAALVALFRRVGYARRGKDPILAPITRELYLEGRSTNTEVGEFRGQALAATLNGGPGTEPAPDHTSYLVDDVRKVAPVWVRGAEVRRVSSGLRAGAPVIGYVTLSQHDMPAQVDEPAREIEHACERADWELLEVVTDRENGVGALERPGLRYALDQIAEGKASGLVVPDLRRLGRSICDLGALMEWFTESDGALVGLDLGVDTSTQSGRDLAVKLIRVSGWERERVARRTPPSGAAPAATDTVAAPAATGTVAAPAAPEGSPSRPSVTDRPALVQRINAMRAANMTLQAIADQLNAEGVPTLRGGAMWRPSSVQTALGYRRPGSRQPRDPFPPLEERT
jgi:DNA invertase Pin-like site-specific DNA recombinase/peptidoglycan hydrolase-like protein with peptidoglycan-binding domain